MYRSRRHLWSIHYKVGLNTKFLLLLAALLCQNSPNTLAAGHPSKTSLIDDFCSQIRREFLEDAPRYFSGPDPWKEIDHLPDSLTDLAVATVHSEGPRVRWLVLVMASAGGEWFETTQYFFDEKGLILKRERQLEHNASNIRIDESIYYDQAKMIKKIYHHSQLSANQISQKRESNEKWDVFFDPDAPEYISTGSLPALFTEANALVSSAR
jgi:hypothetical protein